MSNGLVWELSDMLNQLMVIPNAIALLALTGHVVRPAHTLGRLSDRKRADIAAKSAKAPVFQKSRALFSQLPAANFNVMRGNSFSEWYSIFYSLKI